MTGDGFAVGWVVNAVDTGMVVRKEMGAAEVDVGVRVDTVVRCGVVVVDVGIDAGVYYARVAGGEAHGGL